jgi:hypothetical protein
MTEWIFKEGKALAILFLYFLFYYGIFIILKKLILAHYHISFFGFSGAVLGALISAKAVMIVESTALSKVLRSAAPFLKVIFDCFLYTTLALILLYLEKVVELAHKEGNIRLAFLTVGRDDDLAQFFAMVIWAGLSFLGYTVFSAISRHLGHGELIRLFFTSPGKKSLSVHTHRRS